MFRPSDFEPPWWYWPALFLVFWVYFIVYFLVAA